MTIDEIVIGTEISGHFDLALKAIMQNVLPCGRFSLFDVVDFFKLLRITTAEPDEIVQQSNDSGFAQLLSRA